MIEAIVRDLFGNNLEKSCLLIEIIKQRDIYPCRWFDAVAKTAQNSHVNLFFR